MNFAAFRVGFRTYVGYLNIAFIFGFFYRTYFSSKQLANIWPMYEYARFLFCWRKRDLGRNIGTHTYTLLRLYICLATKNTIQKSWITDGMYNKALYSFETGVQKHCFEPAFGSHKNTDTWWLRFQNIINHYYRFCHAT